MSTSAAVPTALIVHAHPEPDSFSTAQMAAAAQSLRGVGYQVDVLDLYDDAWAPVLAREEFAPVDGPFKPQAEQMRAVRDGTLDEAVRDHLERLLAADLLVLSFPLWWFSLPAILKGWIDRVFVMGAVFGGDHGIFGDAALAASGRCCCSRPGAPVRRSGPVAPSARWTTSCSTSTAECWSSSATRSSNP